MRIGTPAKIAQSLERPAMTTSAPSSSARSHGSSPIMPTMRVARSMVPASNSGAGSSGVMRPSRRRRFRYALSCSAWISAIGNDSAPRRRSPRRCGGTARRAARRRPCPPSRSAAALRAARGEQHQPQVAPDRAHAGTQCLPVPSEHGPGSVEPASQPMKCGLRATPASSDASRKPDPQTPVPDSTRTSTSARGVHTVATGVTGEPAAPGNRNGGAVSRKRLRRCSRSHARARSGTTARRDARRA